MKDVMLISKTELYLIIKELNILEYITFCSKSVINCVCVYINKMEFGFQNIQYNILF